MRVLYEDKYCQITVGYIIIYKYYFPLATSKTIMFEDVAKITIEDGTKVNHIWGPSPSHLNNWFHFDKQRGKKDRFLSIKMKGQKILPSLTPEDVRKVFEILRIHFAQLERKSVMFISNRDKQTEMAHNEVHEEMMEEMKPNNVEFSNPNVVKVLSQRKSEQKQTEKEKTEEKKEEKEEKKEEQEKKSEQEKVSEEENKSQEEKRSLEEKKSEGEKQEVSYEPETEQQLK